jgi:hypothetical protein
MLVDGGIRYKLRAIEDYLASGQPPLEHTDEMLREMRALDAHPARLAHAELYWVTEPYGGARPGREHRPTHVCSVGDDAGAVRRPRFRGWAAASTRRATGTTCPLTAGW